MILVSPSEPKEFLNLIPNAARSTFPERFGADFLMTGSGLTAGVQRKTVVDLIASLENGRLVHEVNRIKRLDVAALIIESCRVPDDINTKYTANQIMRLTFSIFAEGVWVLHARTLEQTALGPHHRPGLGRVPASGVSRPRPNPGRGHIRPLRPRAPRVDLHGARAARDRRHRPETGERTHEMPGGMT